MPLERAPLLSISGNSRALEFEANQLSADELLLGQEGRHFKHHATVIVLTIHHNTTWIEGVTVRGQVIEINPSCDGD